MRLMDILTAERVQIMGQLEGKGSKTDAIERLAGLLSRATGREPTSIFKALAEREQLQSTGIGDGVAIPHGSLDSLEQQTAAMLLCPDGIEFDSIDGSPARILVGVIGPQCAKGEHLRILARISRLLRDGAFRDRLLSASDGSSAFRVVCSEEESRP